MSFICRICDICGGDIDRPEDGVGFYCNECIERYDLEVEETPQVNKMDYIEEEIVGEVAEENHFVQMSTKNEHMQGKTDYQLLGIFKDVSKRNPNECDRYLYEKDMDKKGLMTMLGKEKNGERKPIVSKTFDAKLSKLIDVELVKEEIDEKGNRYYLLPAQQGKLNYVKVHIDTLRFLVNTSNSDVIKVYCYYKQLFEISNKKNRECVVTRKTVCEKLGLNWKTNKKNLDKISDINTALRNSGLISTDTKPITNNGKVMTYTKIMNVFDKIMERENR